MAKQSTAAVPRNVEELVQNRKWMAVIEYGVARFYANPATRPEEDYEDLVADIVCRMLRRDAEGRDYVERWDHKKGSNFKSWLNVMVVNRCIHRRRHAETEAGQKMRCALRIVQGAPEDERGVAEEGNLRGPDHFIEGSLMVRQVMREIIMEVPIPPGLSGQAVWRADGSGGLVRFPDGTEVPFDAPSPAPPAVAGRTFRRDAAGCLDLLLAGCSPADIRYRWAAESVRAVRSLVEQIRRSPAALRLHAEVRGTTPTPLVVTGMVVGPAATRSAPRQEELFPAMTGDRQPLWG